MLRRGCWRAALARGLATGLLLSGMLWSAQAAEARKVSLEGWDYVKERVDLYQKKADEYHKLHPDVEIKFTTVPFGEYFSKILTSMAGGSPPDMFIHHPSQVSSFEGMLSPFPKDLFPLDKMDDNLTFTAGFVVNGEFYLYPVGLLSALVFYNKDLWEEAGMGNVPQTWAELRTAARKLTQKDGGVLKVAGFSFAKEIKYLWPDLNYQMGGYLFNEKKTGVTWDTPEGQKAIDLIDAMLRDGISDLPNRLLDFAAGKAAMEYGWGWKRVGYSKVKGLRWDVFQLPTTDGDNFPARARSAVALGFSVPYNVPAADKAETFKFLQWLYSSDDFLVQLNELMGTVPTRRSLWSHSTILKDNVFRTTVKQLPYTVLPGEFPSWVESILDEMQTAITVKGVAARLALKQAQEKGDAWLKKEPAGWVIERVTRPRK